MNYQGERFLLKLYRELYNEESVKHSGEKSDTKFELVRKYLERLEKTEKFFTREKEGALNYLKNRYYDKYLIKEEDIPESYYELQKKIALERGYGHINFTDELKHEDAQSLIKEQKKSLDKWLNYFMKENTSYPMWARYWAFQGMLKLGKYDAKKHTFSKRSKGTTSPFVELNPEALAITISTIINYQNGKQIDDKKLESLTKDGSFAKLYAYNIWKTLEDERNIKNNKLDGGDGKWKLYTNGYQEILDDIEGKSTGWCIISEEIAEEYYNMGNIHIYFTKDKSGNYTIPRVCIREEYGNIAEVRGVLQNQNLEPQMIDITDKKLDEFSDGKLYKKKLHDMEILTEIYEKSRSFKELSKKELEFLYELNEKIIGFGYEKDPRISEIKRTRNNVADLALIFNIDKNQIGTNKLHLREQNRKIFYGDINLNDLTFLRQETCKLPEIVYGNVKSDKIYKPFKSITNLACIKGNADFKSLICAIDFENLKIIEEDANFRFLESAEGLNNLTTVGRDANFNSLETAHGLDNLTSVGEYANFDSLKNTEGLEKLTTIGTDANFDMLESAEHLKSLTTIGKDAIFNSLTNANGLNNLTSIRGSAYFETLENANGFDSLKAIGNSARFQSLANADGLNNLKLIGGDAFFTNLETADGLESLTTIGGDAFFTNLQSLKGLENLESAKNLFFGNSKLDDALRHLVSLNRFLKISFGDDEYTFDEFVALQKECVFNPKSR